MSIGYACLTVGVNNTGFKSCTLKNAGSEKLLELIEHNLTSLENIIDYNIENNILLFRISSDIIPFGSSTVNNIPWWDIFEKRFQIIGEKIRKSKMRVSMHPGQYTVLNSPKDDVVERAMEDLIYHNRFLDCLNAGRDSKIILHIGGVYGDKTTAVMRFMDNYKLLDENMKSRLIIENDDKSFNIRDVLDVGIKLNIPIVYDNLHNASNPYDNSSDDFWIRECSKTWDLSDGRQKVHYSQQNQDKKKGSHSETIGILEFMDYYRSVVGEKLDIMLEVKDKNLSCIKCINSTVQNGNIKYLEKEWSRYKYSVLEKSPEDYLKIRQLLKNKNVYDAVSFYNILECAMSNREEKGHAINALQHVWGYFKDLATENEKNIFMKLVDGYMKSETSLQTVKNHLKKLTIKYRQEYLKNSYYFIFN
jgi:UV DNA damage endonuclease